MCEKNCERCGKRFISLEAMISHHQETPHYGIQLKAACLLPYPHSDPGFIYAFGEHDTWFVPFSELEVNYQDKLGRGSFGSVYSGKLRNKIRVAVKILLLKSRPNDRVLKDFLKEKNVILKIMTSCNEIQLVRKLGSMCKGSKVVFSRFCQQDIVEF